MSGIISRWKSACELAIVLLIVAVPRSFTAAAPMPIHAYEFQGDFADSGTGNVPIQSEGGIVGPEYFEFDPIYPGDYNEGLTLSNVAVRDPGVYSIEMRLKYNRLRNETPPGPYGPDQAWIKTIDFTDGLFSYGLYVEDVVRWEGPGEEGKIEFIASTTTPPFFSYPGVSPDGVILADTWFHTVATRDASGVFSCYINGVEVFHFTDSRDDAVIDAPDRRLRFFQPDEQAILEYNVYEVTKGAIDYLRIYDEALTAEEVSQLYSPSIAGDYNENGAVDAADYTVWRDTLGTTEILPNDPVGGAIGLPQYENWKSSFGFGAGASLAGAATPEPSTVALVVIAHVLLSLNRRRTA